MKSFKFISLLPVAFAQIVPSKLPIGAHDAVPILTKPNICNDKCDVFFMQFYQKCKDELDCVKDSRKLTCQRDFSCSMNCGYTAEGCVNPLIKIARDVSTTCLSTAFSTKTVTQTLTRPTLEIGLIAAEMPEDTYPANALAALAEPHPDHEHHHEEGATAASATIAPSSHDSAWPTVIAVTTTESFVDGTNNVWQTYPRNWSTVSWESEVISKTAIDDHIDGLVFATPSTNASVPFSNATAIATSSRSATTITTHIMASSAHHHTSAGGPETVTSKPSGATIVHVPALVLLGMVGLFMVLLF